MGSLLQLSSGRRALTASHLRLPVSPAKAILTAKQDAGRAVFGVGARQTRRYVTRAHASLPVSATRSAHHRPARLPPRRWAHFPQGSGYRSAPTNQLRQRVRTATTPVSALFSAAR
jgi:hypothetical protein